MTLDRQASFSGTKAVPAALSFDVARLASVLEAKIPGFAGPIAVSQFKGGQSNPTYAIETPAARYVLRRKPPGPLLPSAHAVDREFRVISALSAAGFPVARPLLYEADADVIGTPFYVMSFVGGRVFWDPEMPDAAPSERMAVYDAMNATIARLHRFDPEALGLKDFGKGENYVGRQVERWSKQYRASETEPIAAMDRLIAWLPDHLPPPQPARLVHGDFRLDNLIVAADRPDVAAVLDWELSTLGDPLADFTYHLMTWVMPRSEDGAGTGSLADIDLPRLGIPDMPHYAALYAARTGFDPMPHLPNYLAYNFFRLAAILQGIVGRVRDGTATNADAARMASMVGPLAAAGWRFAEGAA